MDVMGNKVCICNLQSCNCHCCRAEQTAARFSINLLKKSLLKERRNLGLADKESPFLCLLPELTPFATSKINNDTRIQGKEAKGKSLEIPNRHSTELLIMLTVAWINYHLIQVMFCLNCLVFPAVLKITYFHKSWRVSEAHTVMQLTMEGLIVWHMQLLVE